MALQFSGMNKAFQSLMARMDEFKRHDSGSLKLKAASWEDDEIVLTVEVSNSIRPTETWQLKCHDVRNASLVRVAGVYAKLDQRHQLLLPYTEPFVELYFRGSCADAHSVVGQLLQVHREVVGDWFEFMHFINPSARAALTKLFEGGFGMLAAGPRSLIECYAQVLQRNGLDLFAAAEIAWTMETRKVAS
jgi:hypothetical protein